MRILLADDTITVLAQNGTATWKVSDLLTVANNWGYTSFFTIYFYTDYPMVILCNPLFDSDSVYVMDYVDAYNNHQVGGNFGGNTPYKSKMMLSNNAGTNLYEGNNVNLSTVTRWDKFYYYYPMNNGYYPSGSECVFATSLDYSKIYLNNEDVTPISYNWQSVPSISGKNGILSLACLKDELLTGSDVLNLTAEDFTALPDAARFDNLFSNIGISDEVVPIFYCGQVDYIGVRHYDSAIYELGLYQGGYTLPFYTVNISNAGLQWLLGFCIDDENEVAQLATVRTYSDQTKGYIVGTPTDEEMHMIWLFIHGHREDEPTDEDNQPEADGDIDGEWHDTTISGLEVPGISAIDTGFTSMYEIPLGNLQRLSQYLWSSNFVDNVKKFFNDPREIVIGLSIMPIQPDVGTAKNIKAGGIDTGAIGRPLTSQYKLLADLGSINIDMKKKRKFLNFPPYTKITAHLPYCGCHSIDVNDVMGKTLTLSYMFDFLSGSCIAQLSVNGKPKYFFGGNCGMQIPISSEDYNRIFSGILSAGAALGGTLSTIATGGMTAPLMLGAAANMLSNGMQMTPDVAYSSGGGSINGMLSSQTAFLIIETPEEKLAANQDKFAGRASYITVNLEDDNIKGFIKCFALHLDTFGGMASERSEAEKALMSGIRIEDGNSTPEYTPTTARDHGIIFMKCKSDTDVMGKTWTDELTVEGKLLYEQDIMKPVFVVEGNYSAYNYAYIPEFGRFYHITEQLIKTGNITEVHLQEDVLQSWKDDILQNDVILERSETEYNTYMNDPEVWTQQNKNVAIVPFLTDVGNQVNFERGNNVFILTIAGSDTTPD